MRGKYKQVFIYCVRHGEKETEGDDPGLTEKGRRQARAIAQRLNILHGVRFVAAYHSEMRRALETVKEMLDALSHLLIPIMVEPGLGYQWLLKDPVAEKYSLEKAMKRIAEVAETEGQKKFSHWLRFYPPVLAYRGRFIQTLIEIARQHAQPPEHPGQPMVLVASHSPVIESGSASPLEIPCLNEGDVICYRVGVGIDEPYEAEARDIFTRKCPLEE